jgi:hypothetical protein
MARRPMKKKGGGPLAGIPRQSGERSPTGNGAANNMVRAVCLSSFIHRQFHSDSSLWVLVLALSGWLYHIGCLNLCQNMRPSPSRSLEHIISQPCDPQSSYSILEPQRNLLTLSRMTTTTTAVPVAALATWCAATAARGRSTSTASTPR